MMVTISFLIFNDYFVSEARIPLMVSSEVPSLISCLPHTLAFINADVDLVFKLLSSANVTKACGYDGISNKIIQLCSEGLCNVLKNLINTSFRLSQYPRAWKLANVLPLFKKDDRQLKTNFRPDSLLSYCVYQKICL